MQPFSKLLIGAGIVLVIIGLLWMAGGRFLPLGRLPGDVSYETGRFKLFFPVVSCLLISVVLSAILYLARWFMR